MRLVQHQGFLRQLEGIRAKFSFQICVLGTPADLESVLRKSSTIPVCLCESCPSHDVTRVHCYCSLRVALRGVKKYHLFNQTCKTNFKSDLFQPSIFVGPVKCIY